MADESKQLSNELHTHDHDEEHDEYKQLSALKAQNSVTLGLALLAGLGFVLVVVVAGVGVVEGANADDDTLGVLFLIGIMLFVGGLIAWAGVARPWERFPDVTEGYYDKPDHVGHGDEDDHDGQAALPEGEHSASHA